MADGTITFSTALDNKELEKQLNGLTRKISTLEDKLSQKRSERTPMEEQAQRLGVQLDIAKAKLYEMQNASSDAFSPDLIREQQIRVNGLQSEWNGVQGTVERYDVAIRQAEIELDRNRVRAGEIAQELGSASIASELIGPAVERASRNMALFGMRLREVVRSALIFTVISQAAAGIRDWLGGVVTSNKEASESIARLKGALLTLIQPLVNVVIPAFTAFVNVLTEVITAIARVVSMIAGTTVEASAASAEALNNETTALDGTGTAAKKASKALASFDEINQLSSGDSDSSTSAGTSSSGISPDFSSLEGLKTQEYKDKIDEITVYVSGALLALGVILAFSGANIPLGLGLMALGAVGLATEISEHWGEVGGKVMNAINNTLVIGGTLFLAIGAVLTFSGANIVLGIALMALGAASLVTAVALNWDTVKAALASPIGRVAGIFTGLALLALGAALAFTGVALPLGITLMAIGATSLVTTVSLNWDAIKNALKSPVGAAAGVFSGLALLALGATLSFSGVALPQGIALMAAGAVSLVTVTALNWNAVSEALKGPIGAVVAGVSVALLALGALLCFTGVAIPLGIALIAAGAIGLATVASLNWDALVPIITTAAADVLAVLSGALMVVGILLCLSGVGIGLGLALLAAGFAGSYAAWKVDDNPITNFVKKMANSIILIINGVIDAINNMFHISFNGLNLLGKTIIPAFDTRLVNIPHIPALANGAVIPPNQEFLAMLGDQKSGTNIETPLSTMIEAFRQAGGGEVTINNIVTLDGEVVFQNQKKVSKRHGTSLA